MEADSENRGRGRPPIFPEEFLDMAASVGRGANSSRARRDRAHAGLVMGDLLRHYEGDERLGWLINDRGSKWSLLTELSRIRQARGDDALWEAADWLLENRPKVKYGVAVLRTFRTGTAPQGSVEGLYEVLRRSMDDYLMTHSGTIDDLAEPALLMLLDTVRDSRD